MAYLARRGGVGVLSVLSVAALSSGCERNPTPNTPTGAKPASASTASSKPANAPRVIFPEALHCPDESVNHFVLEAMRTTTQGDYDNYRLLWSAFEKPISRREYEEGWSAVQAVKLRALEKVKVAGLPNPEKTGNELVTVYLLAADVSIDPNHRLARRTSPERDVILMLISEKGQWRLAEPPPRLKTWLRDRIQQDTPQAPASDLANAIRAQTPDE